MWRCGRWERARCARAHSVAALLLVVALALVVVVVLVVIRLLLVHSHRRRARLVLRSLRGVARLDLAPTRRKRMNHQFCEPN